MNKENMELRKAIREGVAEGILTAEKKKYTPPTITVKDQAEALRTFCVERPECDGCQFWMNPRGCLINSPHRWGIGGDITK